MSFMFRSYWRILAELLTDSRFRKAQRTVAVGMKCETLKRDCDKSRDVWG